MNTIDLAELIPRCHEASKANGWWEPRPNAGQQLMLVVSELSEALEADRNGRRALWDTYHGDMQLAGDIEGVFATLFRENIKDSVGDELADAYIRLCDFAGGFELEIPTPKEMEEGRGRGQIQYLPENFGEALLEATTGVIDLYREQKFGNTDYYPGDLVAAVLITLEALCAREGIDLATHIDLKLTYNATRGQKHGGKAY
jgi:hypothetical protein